MPRAYRILFFTKQKRRTQYTIFIIRALGRLGCRVRRINMNSIRRYLGRSLADRAVRLYARLFRIDAVFVFSSDIQDETLDHLGTCAKTAILLDDYFPTDAPVTERAKRVDVFFHTMTGQLEEYRAAGVRRPVYVHSGVDPDQHRPGEPHPEFMSDVAFIGRAVYPDRLELIGMLHEKLDLKVYGRGWERFGVRATREEIAVRDFSRVCTSAKVILGIDKAADRELYFSNRTWFVLGCRGFLVTRYVPGLEKIFANHKHLVWFRSKEEALDQIQFYLAHAAARERIAKSGYEFVHENYPFDRMAANMLSVLLEDGEVLPLTDPGPPLSREDAW